MNSALMIFNLDKRWFSRHSSLIYCRHYRMQESASAIKWGIKSVTMRVAGLFRIPRRVKSIFGIGLPVIISQVTGDMLGDMFFHLRFPYHLSINFDLGMIRKYDPLNIIRAGSQQKIITYLLGSIARCFRQESINGKYPISLPAVDQFPCYQAVKCLIDFLNSQAGIAGYTFWGFLTDTDGSHRSGSHQIQMDMRLIGSQFKLEQVVVKLYGYDMVRLLHSGYKNTRYCVRSPGGKFSILNCNAHTLITS